MRRDERGRWKKAEETSDDVVNEIGGIAAKLWAFWKMLPYLIIIFVAWRYFAASETIQKLLIEIILGEKNCSCKCETRK